VSIFEGSSIIAKTVLAAFLAFSIEGA
jgi:hypothetical protein